MRNAEKETDPARGAHDGSSFGIRISAFCIHQPQSGRSGRLTGAGRIDIQV